MKIPGRIPELDGVRGIAVLLVVVCHAFMFNPSSQQGLIAKLASYGTTGVDLFFVLSGFLITGILLDAKGHPAYFRNFYAKRGLRIWPLYYLLLLISFGLVPLLVSHAHLAMGELALLQGTNKLVYILLLQNFWYPLGASPTVLAMTWSLAIEEQFYIVWPWLVLLCSRKKLAYILGGILFLSPWLRLWARLHGVNIEAIYTGTCFRLDGLALGALIALWCKSGFFSPRRAKWVALSALAVGLPGSLWLLGGYSQGLWCVLYSVLSLASAGAVTFAIWCSQSNSVFGRPFRAGWLRYIGQVSYCLYLVHQPVYYVLASKFARNYISTSNRASTFVMVLGFGVSLGIASLSWYLFESQILRLKDRLTQHRQSSAVATAA